MKTSRPIRSMHGCARACLIVSLSIVWFTMSASAEGLVSRKEPTALLPLSFTADQVQAGKNTFLSSCVLCHKADLSGGFGPPLRGSAFTGKWFSGSVGTLFTFVQTNMPRNAPGTLSSSTVSDLLAYIASENGKYAGDTALSDDVMILVEIGFDQSAALASTERRDMP